MAGGPGLFRVVEPFDGRLSVSERPMGFTDLEDEAWQWKAAGIGAIVSMLDADEAADLGLQDEGKHCRAQGIDFISCPVSDHGIPDDVAVLIQAIDRALVHLDGGRAVAAHCFAGVGRSPLFVASVLVRYGVSATLAWERLRAARGLRVPDTRAQTEWVIANEAMLRSGRHHRVERN